MKQLQIDPAQRIVEATGKPLSPVKEQTMDPAQFPILLRERLQGKSVAEATGFLGVRPDAVNRLLADQWRPSKAICRRIGLKVVYALTEAPKAESSCGTATRIAHVCARARVCAAKAFREQYARRRPDPILRPAIRLLRSRPCSRRPSDTFTISINSARPRVITKRPLRFTSVE